MRAPHLRAFRANDERKVGRGHLYLRVYLMYVARSFDQAMLLQDAATKCTVGSWFLRILDA